MDPKPNSNSLSLSLSSQSRSNFLSASLLQSLPQLDELRLKMGCRKVEMKLIQDRKRRLATYRKRKVGLQNKARELGTLCGVSALVVCVGPDGQVDTWPTPHKEVEDIVANYRSLCPDRRNKDKLSMDQIVKKKLDEMSEEALRLLADSLDLKMACIKERIRVFDIVRNCIQVCGNEINGTLGCEDWDACQKVACDHQQEEMVFNPCIENMVSAKGVAEDAFLAYPHGASEMEAVSLQQIGSERDSTVGESGLDSMPIQEHMDFSSTTHVAMDAYSTSPYGFSDAIFDGWISSWAAFSQPPASPPLTTNAADLSFARPQFESTFGMSANSLLTATGGREDFCTSDLGFGLNDMQYHPAEGLRHWLSGPQLTCTTDLGFGLNDMQCYPAHGLQHCPSDARLLTGIAGGGDAYTADIGFGLNELPFAHLLAQPQAKKYAIDSLLRFNQLSRMWDFCT